MLEILMEQIPHDKDAIPLVFMILFAAWVHIKGKQLILDPEESIAFREKKKGWTSFQRFKYDLFGILPKNA